MKKRSLLITFCVLLCSFSLVACGSKEDTQATESLPAETQESYDTSVEDYSDVETDADGNIIETTPAQNLTVKLNVDKKEEETSNLPIEEFKKYGKVIKAKDGYRVLTKDSEYLSEAIITYEDGVYYFNEDGYLANDVFLPAKNSDGKVVTYFVHNYKYTFGLVETPIGKYYIDEEKGKLTSCAIEVDGKEYFFDDTGKSIGKKTYELRYSNNSTDETELETDLETEVESSIEEELETTEGQDLSETTVQVETIETSEISKK